MKIVDSEWTKSTKITCQKAVIQKKQVCIIKSFFKNYYPMHYAILEEDWLAVGKKMGWKQAVK